MSKSTPAIFRKAPVAELGYRGFVVSRRFAFCRLDPMRPLEVVDDVTFALAVIGAVTGTIGTTVQAMTAWRDRSQIKLFLHNIDNAQGQFVRLDVLNDSPRATTVREAGLYHRKVHMQHLASDGKTVLGEFQGAQVWKFLDTPTLFEAGETKSYTWPIKSIDAPHIDSVLRCYAMDARGRHVWGQASPVLRIALGPEIALGADAPLELMTFVAARERPELPEQVEPSWKLWKRRELRNPKAWRNPLTDTRGYKPMQS